MSATDLNTRKYGSAEEMEESQETVPKILTKLEYEFDCLKVDESDWRVEEESEIYEDPSSEDLETVQIYESGLLESAHTPSESVFVYIDKQTQTRP